MVQFPVKTYKSFIFNTQSERLLQSFLPWANKNCQTPPLGTSQHSRCHIENISPASLKRKWFIILSTLLLLHLSNPLEKKQNKKKNQKNPTDWKHQNISNTKIFFLSQSRISSHFSASPMWHASSHSHWTGS